MSQPRVNKRVYRLIVGAHLHSLPLTLKTVLCCALALFLHCTSVSAQRPNIRFEHLDINSGLSQNHISCILEDSRGYMWFGTRDGLNKYDGYKFTVFKNDPADSFSISNNFVTGIQEDSKGMIWVATRGGGLNRYDRTTNRFIQFRNQKANTNSLSSDLSAGMIIDHDDNLWICSEDGGVDLFEPKTCKFTHFSDKLKGNNGLSENGSRCIFEDSKGNIWIGLYTGGLNLFDRKTKAFTYFRNDKKDPASLGHNHVASIYEDRKGQIWIGTVGGGLNRLNRETGKFQRYIYAKGMNSIPSDVVYAITEDVKGNLWIGTENGGLSIYDPVKETFYNYSTDNADGNSLSHTSVWAIHKDRYGSMWVGTFAGGINIFNKNANRFAHYKHTSDKNSLSHNNVLCMANSHSGKIWVATDGGGLNLFDPITKDFRHYIHQPGNPKSICGNYVLSVREDTIGDVWVGTWGAGITVFNAQRNTFRHFKNNPDDPSSLSSNNAWVIFEDSDKNIWVGTYYGGLNLFDRKNNKFIRFEDTTSRSTRTIHSITEDGQGNLWIGTDGGGLQVFDKKKKTFRRYIHDPARNSISDNRVNYVYEDKTGNFWINTMAGLNYLDTKKQVFTHYTTADGLPNNVIFGMMEDDNGLLWLSTNGGLTRFDPRDCKFRNFGTYDGLQSYEFKMGAFCKHPSGVMYFGGINGFNEFIPANIKEEPFEFPIVLTDFQVFNKKVAIARNDHDVSPLEKDISETKQITLPYSSSVISFEFASLNYSSAEKKQYAYILEGFDKRWNEIGRNRSATYTNLDPGRYTFRVKGLNNEGNWSDNVTSLELIITPPFWKTWWFKFIAAFVISGSLVMFFRWRMNNARRMQKLLEQKVTEQTLQLVSIHQEEHKARMEAEEAKDEASRANLELERKNKELEQFVYIASHDLREPLRTTSSFIDLFQKQYKGNLDDKADKYLSYVSQATDRMRTLINDLLDYSRISNHQQLDEVNCNYLVADILTDLGTIIKENDAQIITGLLPTLHAYQTNLKQLFQNLIANGIKFRNQDVSPVVHIDAKECNGSWHFVIRDNGIGIDEKHKDRIFVIFQRLHTRSEYEGSGIGLAHCKKIVELHGGKIWVESKPGNGSSFHFTIPKDLN